VFFVKDKKRNKDINLIKVAALLIHVAKIDENFSEIEEKIIKKTLIEMGAEKDALLSILKDAKKIEENSNQILEFTKEVKSMNEINKIKILETLWKIIYSNNEADMYETTLMRRLEGLLYIDNKTMGNIKQRIKSKYLK
tara:strand:+ start:331 stop:747 length:417 start_codon:yes stop_codon:yes gene_type:complete